MCNSPFLLAYVSGLRANLFASWQYSLCTLILFFHAYLGNLHPSLYCSEQVRELYWFFSPFWNAQSELWKHTLGFSLGQVPSPPAAPWLPEPPQGCWCVFWIPAYTTRLNGRAKCVSLGWNCRGWGQESRVQQMQGRVSIIWGGVFPLWAPQFKAPGIASAASFWALPWLWLSFIES